jgi:TP901 family phage tail tape measure protein
MASIGDLFIQIGSKFNDEGLKAGMAGLNKFGDTTKKTSSIMDKFVFTFGDAMNAAKKLAQSLGSPIKAAADFEAQMANVSTMLDKQSMKQLPSLSNSLRKMATVYGQSTETLSKGLYDILSAGISAEKAIKVLEASTIAATAGLSTTGIAADALTTILNSYGLSAEKAGDVSDWFFAIIKRGKTTFAELGPQIGQVASLASSAGLSMDEFGAALATMTKSGVKTDIAITSLKSILNGFLSPSKEATKASKKLGIELNTNTLRTQGLVPVLKKLNNATDEEVASIFGNVRALTGLSTILKDTSVYYDDLTSMQNRAGASQEAFEKQSNTLNFQLKKLGETFNDLKIDLGNKLVPVIKDVNKQLNETIEIVKKAPGFIEAYGKIISDTQKKWGQNASPLKSIKKFMNEVVNVSQEYGKLAAEYWGDAFEEIADTAKKENKKIVRDEKKTAKNLEKISQNDKETRQADKESLMIASQGYLNLLYEYEVSIGAISLENYKIKLQEKLDSLTGFTEANIELMKQLDEVDKKLNEEKETRFKNTMSNITNTINAYGSFLSNFSTYQSTLIRNNLEESLDAELEKYNDKKEWINENVSDEEEKSRMLEDLEREYNDTTNELRDRSAKEEAKRREQLKPYLVAEAIANTAVGVTKAFSQGGIFGFVTGALVAAAGAIQVATIRAQKFAKGVKNFVGGMAIVGEEGPELVNLPRGSSVYSNEDSRQILASTGAINIDLRGSVFSSKKAYKDLEDSLFRVIKNNRKI